MRLRTRLALTLGLAVIPLAVALAMLQQWRRHANEVELVRESVVARMEAGGREVCEADPERFRGRARAPVRGPGARNDGRRGARHAAMERRAARGFGTLEPYALDGSSARGWRAAPAELLASVRAGEPVASRRGTGLDGRSQYEVLVAMPWSDGPCALILTHVPVQREAVVTSALTGVGVGLAAVVVAWLAAAPLVRRLRRLADAAARGPGKSAVTMVGGDDEVTAVARALDADRERIDAQVQQLQQRDAALVAYIANTTHDVMLPLTVLQGHLVAARELLATAASERLDRSRATGGSGPSHETERARGLDDTLRLAVEESDYLGSLLRNLNVRARLDSANDAHVREPVDLAALVERVVARHSMIARDRGVSLDFAVPDEPTLALGDVTLLERALSNVVHNAVRYNDPGGHVAVVLTGGGAGFILRVSDDGPGLEPDDLARLTERGYRGNVARTRHPHGMGLGLHITQDVLREHGFTLRIARPQGAERGLEVLIRGEAVDAGGAEEPLAER